MFKTILSCLFVPDIYYIPVIHYIAEICCIPEIRYIPEICYIPVIHYYISLFLVRLQTMLDEQKERLLEKQTDINRLEGEIMKNEEEVIDLKQTLVEKKDKINEKESEVSKLRLEIKDQAEQHKNFVQVVVGRFKTIKPSLCVVYTAQGTIVNNSLKINFQDSFRHMEDELQQSQKQYRACLEDLEQFERKIQELERDLSLSREVNNKSSRDVIYYLSY